MHKNSIRRLFLATALGALLAAPALAQSAWTPGVETLQGTIRAGSRDVPVVPGQVTQITGSRLVPGQVLRLQHGADLLTAEPVTVGADGSFKAEITLPVDAAPGLHPIAVIAEGPAAVSTVLLKVSEVVPPLNEAAFHVTTAEVGERAYQAALSADGKLFVASARGKGEVASRLMRLDAVTLAPEAEATLAVAEGEKAGPIDVFGVGVDDAHRRVWTTNTLHETVTVYDADSLTPVKVFAEGSVLHPRDVVIDAARGRAYVNAALTGKIHVFDTATLEELAPIQVSTADGREAFASMSLDLDAVNGQLYTISRGARAVAAVDLESGAVRAFEVPELSQGSGVAHDPETGRLYAVSQDGNNLVVLDGATGAVLADTQVGAGAVAVAFDPVAGQAYVATRAGGTVAVLDRDGTLVGNLPLGKLPNDVISDGKGAVYATTMFGASTEDGVPGTVSRIVAK
ncbi:Vgb family protein [Phaeovulum sp. W22_SRMD_FR3]|uniref:Vgb family protein n=1 Tax=Phaeovulum sp. W22_SRMD_FR3 TaxID=3240274 RepID=UPI003F9BC11A